MTPALTPAAAATSTPSSRFVAETPWAPFPSIPSTGNTYLKADRHHQLLWAMAGGYGSVGVTAFDLGSLTRLASAEPPTPNGVPLTVDPATGDLIVSANDTVPSVQVLHRNGSRIETATTISLGPAQAGRTIVAGQLESTGRFLYILTDAEPIITAGAPQLIQVSMAPTPAVTWTYTLPPPCNFLAGGASSGTALGYVAGNNSVYVACIPARARSGAGEDGVGRVALGPEQSAPAPAGAFTLFPLAGTDSPGSLFDPSTERVLLDLGYASGARLYVFDTHRDSIAGIVQAGQISADGFAVDTVARRVYAHTVDKGFGAGETGLTPPSQMEWAGKTMHMSVFSGHSLTADETRHRIFLAPTTGSAFYVVRDTLAPLDLSAGSDLDIATSNLPEREGLTQRTFDATAQGYGVVSRQVGGVPGALAGTGLQVAALVPQGDPELRTAYLDKLELNGDSANASAVPLGRDHDVNEVQQQTACALTPAAVQSGTCSWPYTPALCKSYGDADHHEASGPGGNAAVACDAQRARASASASYAGPDSSVQGISIASGSFSSALSERDRVGTLAETSADARGISIAGGLLQIGHVSSRARAWAGGHPGSAATEYSRDVADVLVNGTPVCGSSCDPAAVQAAVEAALPGRVQVRFPVPDAGAAKGSPGGYVAAIHSAAAEQGEETAINDRPPSRSEVPGMVILLLNESSQSSRTIVYLAGVQAEARYGIYALPQFAADGAGNGPDVAPGVAPTRASLAELLAPSTPSGLGNGLPAARGSSAAPASAPVSLLSALPHWHGWQWALQHPGLVLRIAAMWLLLMLPAYLVAQRWRLLRRNAIYRATVEA
jgi:hypothetical protein